MADLLAINELKQVVSDDGVRYIRRGKQAVSRPHQIGILAFRTADSSGGGGPNKSS
jgi:hypothetical protein